MKQVFLFVFILLSSNCFSQDSFIVIRGKVLDRKSKSPLAYANIYLKGRSIGTISNESGEFEFKVPVENRNDSLIVSYVGYKNLSSKILDVRGELFYLENSSTQLQEITVNTLTGEQIMRKALASIENNYPVGPNILKAFYRDWKIRESTVPDSSKVTLVEAAISVYDKSYKKTSNELIFVDHVRRSKASGNEYNYLYLLVEQNYVRHTFSRNIGNVFGPFDFKHLTYDLKDIVTQNGENVYLITAESKEVPGQYEFYISASDFGFLRITFKGQMKGDVILGDDKQPWLKRTHQMIYIDNALVFRKYNNRYFLNYLKLNWRTRTLSDVTGETTDTREFLQELLVNEIITEDVEKLVHQYGRPMSNKKSIEQQIKPYSKSFWESFNVIKERPLNGKLMKLLEKDGKIEDQFMNQRSDSSKEIRK